MSKSKNIIKIDKKIKSLKSRVIKTIIVYVSITLAIALSLAAWVFLDFKYFTPIFDINNTSVYEGICLDIDTLNVRAKTRKSTRYILTMDDGSTYFVHASVIDLSLDFLEEQCVGQKINIRYSNTVDSFGSYKIAEIKISDKCIYDMETANNADSGQKDNQGGNMAVVIIIFTAWILLSIIFAKYYYEEISSKYNQYKKQLKKSRKQGDNSQS